jgi:putative peptidoglycan lipid II flippase
VWRVLALMLPVTVALGLVNFDALLNSLVGTLVGASAPAAIDKAFKVYQLPQGLFSVAIATAIFPSLARSVASGDDQSASRFVNSGMRYTLLLLIGSSAVIVGLAHPIIEILYQRGAFTGSDTALTSNALVWWATALPIAGLSSLLWRAFAASLDAWLMAGLSIGALLANVALSLLLYGPLGVGGVILGTTISSGLLVGCEVRILRRRMAELDVGGTALATSKMLLSAVGVAVALRIAWRASCGQSCHPELVQGASLLAFACLGGAGYMVGCASLRVPEVGAAWRHIIAVLPRRRAGRSGL